MRPKILRRTRCKPCCSCFKPDCSCGSSPTVILVDEFEALKLHDVDCLDQKNAARKMKISQPTFARILSSAHKKLAGALVRGEEIRIKV